MNDQEIENEIQAKGLTAPRITMADIKANIVAEYAVTADKATQNLPQMPELKLLTLYIIVLSNGFTVTGESACASPENFDPEIGRKIARENAISKIWPLMGYELKCRLARAEMADRDEETRL